MPIIYSTPVVQKPVPLPTTTTVSFPSTITDWLVNACGNYLQIDHWKLPDYGLGAFSRYGARTGPHINRIPVEILGEIFMYCLEEIVFHQALPLPRSLSPSSEADPQTLGEVCRFWRDVALSTPALWSKIWIYQPQRAQVQRVGLWLKRSREYPLDIRIVQFSASATPDNHAATDDILSLLVEQVHRWRKIHFRFSSTAQQPLLALPMNAPVALESAYVNTWKWEHSSTDRFWRVLHSSPSLRHAEWASYTTGLPSHVPWAQLTGVTMRQGISVEECMTILHGCQNLVAFSVHALWSYETLVDSQGPFTLPRLRHLSFLGCIEDTPFFNRLTLPSLTSLEITSSHSQRGDQNRSCASFRDLLQRSSCRLKTFRLSNPHTNESNLYGYLSAPQMSSLKELELAVPITDRTMLLLTRSENRAETQDMLPNLEAIYIEETCTSDGRISAMILSRMASVTTTPLKAARVRINAQLYPHDLTVFQSIIHDNNWLHVFVT